jgi:hypothetical protein
VTHGVSKIARLDGLDEVVYMVNRINAVQGERRFSGVESGAAPEEPRVSRVLGAGGETQSPPAKRKFLGVNNPKRFGLAAPLPFL